MIMLSVATNVATDIWFAFMINSTCEVSRKNRDLISFHKEPVMTGIEVVAALHKNVIRWERDLTQYQVTPKLTYLPNFSGWDCTKTIKTLLTTCWFIPAPAILRDMIIARRFESSPTSKTRACHMFDQSLEQLPCLLFSSLDPGSDSTFRKGWKLFFLPWYFLSLKVIEEWHLLNKITEHNSRVRKTKHSKSICKFCNFILVFLQCALLCYLKSYQDNP